METESSPNGCCCRNLCSGQHKSTAVAAAASSTTARSEFAAATASSIPTNTQFTNHESLPSATEMFSRFNEAYPNYCNTKQADEIRAAEYYNLSASNRVCLDYIGHGLFSYAQQHGNPRRTQDIPSTSSSQPERSSALSFDILYKPVSLNSQLLYGGTESELESRFRNCIIKYMNIPEDDYSVVFTANQSSAFKLLAESYPFQANTNLLRVYDYESESIEMMIETVKQRGARVLSAEFSWPSLRVNSRKLRKMVVKTGQKQRNGLFVFPLQSRVSGSRYSYQWMNLAHENNWHVLLDASSLGAKDMETLGLSLYRPHFIVCSFFKVFGDNPSGFCCLFVKKCCIAELNKSSTTGTGIVSIVPVFDESDSDNSSSSSSISRFIKIEQKKEKNTEKEKEKIQTNQLSLWELLKMENNAFEGKQFKQFAKNRAKTEIVECRGLDHADELGLILISNRSRYLINWLVNALLTLRHPNEHYLVQIYGTKIKFNRGPAIAFNVFDWKGQRVAPTLVQKLADRHNISVSCAALKNIGFSEVYEEEKRRVLETTINVGEKSSGISVVSVSLGLLTDFEDVYRLWSFVSRFLDADFVEKERWRYMALNQTTLEV